MTRVCAAHVKAYLDKESGNCEYWDHPEKDSNKAECNYFPGRMYDCILAEILIKDVCMDMETKGFDKDFAIDLAILGLFDKEKAVQVNFDKLCKIEAADQKRRGVRRVSYTCDNCRTTFTEECAIDKNIIICKQCGKEVCTP